MFGSNGSSTTTTYYAAIVAALGSGPIAGVGKVWNNKDKTSLLNIGLTLYLGDSGQTAWGYMTSKHPEQAFVYPGLAYVCAPSFLLGSNAELPNLSFEVYGKFMANVGTSGDVNFQSSNGTLDVNPKDVIVDFIQNPLYGAAPSLPLADLTNFSNYCLAANLLVSPAFAEQKSAASHLSDLMQCCHSEFVWSAGQLNIVPYGDATLTGNGVTWVPNLTPQFDLTEDDFIVLNQGDDPIQCSRITSADAYNHVQVEFLNRLNDYNVEIAEAKDQADIETLVGGVAKGVRTAPIFKLHQICDPQIARNVAQQMLQRLCYIRNNYTFILGWGYCQLEPMDLLTLTYAPLGLAQTPVLIKSIEEGEEGDLTVTTEEYPYGVNSFVMHPHQPPLGYLPNYNAPPKTMAPPIVFEPPAQIATNEALEIWVSTAGGADWGGCDIWAADSETGTYQKIGRVIGGTRQGFTTAPLAIGSDPDTTHTLSVDLTPSLGTLLSGTQPDADAYNTLCYLRYVSGGDGFRGELVSYKTATLTGPHQYDLTYLRRGAYGTPIFNTDMLHAFVRVDQSIFKYPLPLTRIGTLVSLKFTSFNRFGGGLQSLADVLPFNYVVTGEGVLATASDILHLVDAKMYGFTILNFGFTTSLSAHTKALTIANNSSIGRTVTAISIVGQDAAVFATSGITLPASLASAATTTVTVTWTPADASKYYSAALQITTDVAVFIVPLTGNTGHRLGSRPLI